MRIIKNKFIPFKGFLAINIYNIIFVRKNQWNYCLKHYPGLLSKMEIHESIHTAQMKDFCSFLPIGGSVFYLVYLCEWVIRLFQNKFNRIISYHAISFEKEAYVHEMDPHYLEVRERFNQWRK